MIAFLGIVGRLDAESHEDRLVAAVGDRAADLIPRIKDIIDALYTADPPLWRAARFVAQLGENACRYGSRQAGSVPP